MAELHLLVHRNENKLYEWPPCDITQWSNGITKLSEWCRESSEHYACMPSWNTVHAWDIIPKEIIWDNRRYSSPSHAVVCPGGPHEYTGCGDLHRFRLQHCFARASVEHVRHSLFHFVKCTYASFANTVVENTKCSTVIICIFRGWKHEIMVDYGPFWNYFYF